MYKKSVLLGMAAGLFFFGSLSALEQRSIRKSSRECFHWKCSCLPFLMRLSLPMRLARGLVAANASAVPSEPVFSKKQKLIVLPGSGAHAHLIVKETEVLIEALFTSGLKEVAGGRRLVHGILERFSDKIIRFQLAVDHLRLIKNYLARNRTDDALPRLVFKLKQHYGIGDDVDLIVEMIESAHMQPITAWPANLPANKHPLVNVAIIPRGSGHVILNGVRIDLPYDSHNFHDSRLVFQQSE